MIWHIPIWFDLWLIGLAGGLVTAAFFLGKWLGDKDRHLFKFAVYAGFPLVILGVLFLLADLGNALRFWHFVTVFKIISPMSLGTWFIITWSILAFVLIVFWWLGRSRKPVQSITRIFEYPLLMFSILIMTYGAVTSAVSSQPLWSSTFFFAPLLVISNISMALAVFILIGAGLHLGRLDRWGLASVRPFITPDVATKLVKINIYLILLQLVSLAAQITGTALSGLPRAFDQVHNLLFGWLAGYFWPGVIVISLGLPAFIYFLYRDKGFQDIRTKRYFIIASAGVIFGGFILRAVLIAAGQT